MTLSNNSWLFCRPIAHRGLHNDTLPENSIGAFENAIRNNFPIELDIHLLKCGTLAVFHDDNLARMTGDKRDIESLTFDEALPLKLLGTEYGIPTLSEVLKLVDSRVPILIEIKSKGKVGALEEKLAVMLENYNGEFAVHSFNPLSLAKMHALAPSIILGLLACNFKGEKSQPFYVRFALRHLLFLKKSAASFINYDISELPLRRVTKCGLPILGWTARTEDEFDRAKQYTRNVIFEGFIPK